MAKNRVPKWIKDQFKELMKDEDFLEQLGGHLHYDTSENDRRLADVLTDECFNYPTPKELLAFDSENTDLYIEVDILKPLPRRQRLIIDSGNLAYDNSIGRHKVTSLPENATHINGYGSEWVEFRTLTDEEYAEQERIRIEYVQKSIDSLIKWTTEDTRKYKKAKEANAKKIAKTANTSTLKTIEFSVTDEQLKAIQEVLAR
jgi:hypothetical protein